MTDDELENKIDHLYRCITQQEMLFNGKFKSLEENIARTYRYSAKTEDQVRTLKAQVDSLENQIKQRIKYPDDDRDVLIKVNSGRPGENYFSWLVGFHNGDTWIFRDFIPYNLPRRIIAEERIIGWRELPTD